MKSTKKITTGQLEPFNKGFYNASTNTPSLSNGTGIRGEYYMISVAGTRNFGAGNITFVVGDRVEYDGTIYFKISQFTYTAENIANKQNSLVTDGTGIKYPTVDAINAVLVDATTSVRGLVNTGTQSFGGNKTIIGSSTTSGSALDIRSGTASILAIGNNNTATVGEQFIFNFTRPTTSIIANSPRFRFSGSNIVTQDMYAEQGNIIFTAGIAVAGVGGVNAQKYWLTQTGSATAPAILYGNGFKGGIYFIGNTNIGDVCISTGNVADANSLHRFIVHRTGNVGIGASLTPIALLDVNSTTQGSLPFPRMTSAQRVAMGATITGLNVYQTDGTEGIYVNKSTGWEILSTPSLTISQTITNGVTTSAPSQDAVFDALVPQIKITTAVSIDTTTTVSGMGQSGRNVIIDNGANAINYTINATDGFVTSFIKTGTASVTFVQGAGRTMSQMDSTAIWNGIPGSRAAISSVGPTDYLYITNY